MKVNKDPAMITSGYDRLENDKYFTIETWVTQALHDTIDIPEGSIWEPACGAGHMSNVLLRNGHDVYCSDIVDHGFGVTEEVIDFLSTDASSYNDKFHIITNPPYEKKECEAFVRHALKHIRHTGGLMAMLLRNEWDSASTRNDLFGHCPEFFMKLVLTKRPRWFEKTEESSSPRHNYSWFIWRGDHSGPASIHHHYERR